ncbi:hypothetical protein [Methanobrevibacter oralis]|uniref:DUF4064 domain-containing protein n=1 Tax=Methanobrevibacter oralis TaxID=66851 RepID=A0A166BEY9_METOA|nr:hypothetical protein [Methanobrevibacter oralis]KZX13254.1 hypothetical protein MBORA_08040 [Methanobrevibacter oralis]
MKRVKRTSRTFELIFGIFGTLLSLFSGSFILFIENFARFNAPFVAVLAFLASIIGVVASVYVTEKTEICGIMFIVAAIFLVVGSSHLGVLGALFLLVAGISALFRK